MNQATLKLVSHDLCPYVQRSVITLAEKGVPYERVDIDLSDKPEWFRKLSPLGKVPLLIVNGATLFESAVICEYLEEITPGALHPGDPLEKARHRSWIEFGSALLNAIGGYYNARDAESFDAARADILRRFRWIEDHLGDGPFFAGARFHMLDAAFGPIFRYFNTFERIDGFDFFAALPKTRRWRAALSARPSVRDAVVPDYPERLKNFVARRGSYLSGAVEKAA